MKIDLINNNLNFKGMIEKEFFVRQEHGIHMLPAGCFAKLTQTSPYDVYIAKGDIERNVRASMLGLLCLEIQKGEKIKIKVDENYPSQLLDTIIACLSAFNNQQSLTITENYLKNHQ